MSTTWRRRSVWFGAITALAALSVLLGGIAIGSGESDVAEYLLRDQTSVAPPGQVLHEQVTDGEGWLVEERYIDPGTRRMRVEKPLNDVIKTVIAYDDGGHTTLNGVTLEVFSAEAGYADAVASLDPYVGLRMQKVGDEQVEGKPVSVLEPLEMELRLPLGTGLRSYVDGATGLRIRDEFREGEKIQSVTTRELLDGGQLGVSLDRLSIAAESASAVDQRLRDLSQAEFAVFGLPKGYEELELSRVVPGPGWTSVRLEYRPTSGSPPYSVVVITSVDPPPDYPEELLLPVDKATEMPDDTGEVLLFGKDGVGITVQVAKDAAPLTAIDVARAIVEVN